MPWDRPPRPPGLREMSPAAMGFVLLILVNGSHNEATALVSWDRDDPELMDALRGPVEGFSEMTTKKKGRGRRARLDEYPSSQARKRLGTALERRKPPGRPMKAWVPVAHRERAMRIVADEVVVEKGVEPAAAIRGLGLLIRDYEAHLAVLRRADRAHSTRGERDRTRREMSALFDAAGPVDH